MKFLVWSVGRERSEYAPMEQEYLRRMSVTTEIRSFENDSRLIKALPAHSTVVLLTEHAKPQPSSEKFATWIQQLLNSGRKNVVFVVAGAFGPSKELSSRADQTLSLSPLTFPHRIARLVLVEQLYRALTILDGRPYHH